MYDLLDKVTLISAANHAPFLEPAEQKDLYVLIEKWLRSVMRGWEDTRQVERDHALDIAQWILSKQAPARVSPPVEPGNAEDCPLCSKRDDLPYPWICPGHPDEHVCKPGAALYYCPTAGEVESDCHGGFDTCCDRPDLHRPPTPEELEKL